MADLSATDPVVSASATRVFDQLGRILHGSSDDRSLSRVLQRVAEAAQQLVPELVDVSVTLVEGDWARTAVFTSQLASDLDERQYEVGSGPSTAASLAGSTVLVSTAEPSVSAYPDFARSAAERGVRYLLSVGLPVPQRTLGALNLYSAADRTFAPESVSLAEALAGYAAVAVANAALCQSAVAEARHMHEILRTRAVIEQARGILMGSRRCGPDEAFILLNRVSQQQDRRIRDVAADLVDRTQGPGTGAGAESWPGPA
ncbi:GAF and ANTAR domain-containing protein [Microlunatus lacustris]